jgi:hypothetical protein
MFREIVVLPSCSLIASAKNNLSAFPMGECGLVQGGRRRSETQKSTQMASPISRGRIRSIICGGTNASTNPAISVPMNMKRAPSKTMLKNDTEKSCKLKLNHCMTLLLNTSNSISHPRLSQIGFRLVLLRVVNDERRWLEERVRGRKSRKKAAELGQASALRRIP